MTTTDKIARRKLSLLDLASELSNVSRACKSLPSGLSYGDSALNCGITVNYGITVTVELR